MIASGENEVPPTESQSTGLAEFNIIGTDSIEYNLNASNIENVTAAHIHGGPEGVNGPILVTLFDHQTPMDQVSENGTITEHNPAFQSGTVTSEQQLHDFMRAMRNGQIYVNIHTEQHPDGEIHGQITTNGGS
jgi:CHRD domain